MAAAPDFPVYDADNHLYETEDALTRHLPESQSREEVAELPAADVERIMSTNLKGLLAA